MDNDKFDAWFSDLKRIAVSEFGLLPSGVDQWNPKGWRTFFALNVPARKALQCMIEFDYGHQGTPPLSGDRISARVRAVN